MYLEESTWTSMANRLEDMAVFHETLSRVERYFLQLS